MSVQLVRFSVARERIPAVTERIESLFAAVSAAAPHKMQYVALREADEPVFTLLLELPDGVENPLPSIPAAADFRGWLATELGDAPAPRPCTVVGKYTA